MQECNRIDRQRLQQTAAVAEVDWHAELPSTNDRALALAVTAQPDQLPLLVVAERQVMGRGRGSNQWWAEEGALTFSLLLDTSALDLPTARWPLASLTTGLAVCETLDQLAPQAWAALKWPNDVYLREQKVCGVLIEAPAAVTNRLVVGIGLNVNNDFLGAPPDVRERATSLKNATGVSFDITEVLLRVLTQLDVRWRQLAANEIALGDVWQRWCLLTGRTVQVAAGDQRFSGRCQGIAADGTLLLHTERGEQRIVAGTVTSWD
jgi:BirA family biotin operon repressor/biotin-[acetyl-CoA-carboxylase] ligase